MKRNFQESKVKQFFSSKWFIIIFLLIALLLIFGFFRSYYRDMKVKEVIRNLETDFEQLSEENLESMEILEFVMSDAYVEEKARTELNLKKPGENVMIIDSGSSNILPLQDYPEEGTRRNISNPLKWWYYFTQDNK